MDGVWTPCPMTEVWPCTQAPTPPGRSVSLDGIQFLTPRRFFTLFPGFWGTTKIGRPWDGGWRLRTTTLEVGGCVPSTPSVVCFRGRRLRTFGERGVGRHRRGTMR